jgi:hypothetical protein
MELVEQEAEETVALLEHLILVVEAEAELKVVLD